MAYSAFTARAHKRAIAVIVILVIVVAAVISYSYFAFKKEVVGVTSEVGPVLFVHGYGSDAYIWFDIINKLVSDG